MTPIRFLAAGALAAGLLAAMPLPAPAQQYAPWQGDRSKLPPAMLDELETIVKAAERDRAASPDFIGDLYDYIDKYREAIAGAPAAAAKFLDTFADGNYTANPTWQVSAGFWSVDRAGSNVGLVSKIRQGPNLGNLLGAILAPQGQQQSQSQQQYAAIYTQASLPGAFRARMRFTSGDPYGALSWALYQGKSGQNSYRLIYQPGSAQGLVLQQATPQGARTIATYDGPLRLEDRRAHDIAWSRDARGRMEIAVDGRSLIKVRDTAVKGDFDGILLLNAGGSYWIREIAVEPQNG